jgi:membrane-associated phospholipid phosphatase
VFKTKRYEEKGQQRTELYSVVYGYNTFITPIVLIGIVIGLYFVYHEPLKDYSLGPNGISHLQATVPESARMFFLFLTQLGGGQELMEAFILFFIFGTRSKSFYYLAVFALDKVQVNMYKLAFAEPRPYMIASNIHPFTCSKQFGMPSGHSSASWTITMCFFLDMFHGKSQPYFKVQYFKWYQYILVLLLCWIWAGSIPFSRYLLGAHSLDQIVFGMINGTFNGIILHFFVRDHFIDHIEWVLTEQNLGEPNRLENLKKRKLEKF